MCTHDDVHAARAILLTSHSSVDPVRAAIYLLKQLQLQPYGHMAMGTLTDRITAMVKYKSTTARGPRARAPAHAHDVMTGIPRPAPRISV